MILFFEGFETVGTEVGLANQATTRPRIHLRWADTGSGGIPSSDSYFLIADPFAEGYAINMGTSSFSHGNFLQFDIPEDRQDAPGGVNHRVWVIGMRVHIPDDPVEDFEIFTTYGYFGGSFSTSVMSLSVVDSTDLQVSRGNPFGGVVGSAADCLIPGGWHYIEIKFKIAEPEFVNRVEQLTGTVTSGSYTLSITIPSLGVSEFTTASIAYNASAATIAAAIDAASPAEVSDGFITVTDSGTQGVFDGYIELTAGDDLEFTVTTDNVSLSGGDVGAVVSGEGGFVEVYVDGTEVINEHTIDTNNALTTGMYAIQFTCTNAGGGAENYVGYDDMYIMDCSEEPHTDFLGPVRVVSLPPNGDDLQEWDNEVTGPNNYSHIDENGASDADYVETDVNGDTDRYDVTNVGGSDSVIAVKMEIESINMTGGSPSIFMQITSGTAVEQREIIKTNNTDYELHDMYVQDNPAGGAWTPTAINAMMAGISFENNVS